MLKTLTVIPILLLVLVAPALVMQEITVLDELGVEGSASVDGVFTAGDNASVAGNLTVTGAGDVGGNLAAGGNLTAGGTLAVTGESTFSADITAADIDADDVTVDNVTASGTLTTPTLRLGSRTLTDAMFPIRGSDLNIGSLTSTGTGERDITLPANGMYRVFQPLFSTHAQDCIVVAHGTGLRVMALPGGDCSQSTTVEIRYVVN